MASAFLRVVVICAGTTGYNATLDLRYHWMRQKRLQGSHFANDDQARGANQLVFAGKVDPCLSRVFGFAETAECHQLMRDNLHPSGNMAILVNASIPIGITSTASLGRPANTTSSSVMSTVAPPCRRFSTVGSAAPLVSTIWMTLSVVYLTAVRNAKAIRTATPLKIPMQGMSRTAFT